MATKAATVDPSNQLARICVECEKECKQLAAVTVVACPFRAPIPKSAGKRKASRARG